MAVSFEELLAGLSPEKLAQIRKDLCGATIVKERKTAVKAEPVTHYNTITMYINCRNCGSVHIVKRSVDRGEIVHTLSIDNKVEHTIVKENCELINYTRCCDDCLLYAKQMTREELEQAYISLLKGV